MSQPSHTGHPRSSLGWQLAMAPFAFLFAFLFGLVVLACLVIIYPPFAIWCLRQDYRLFKRLRRAGRIMCWEEASQSAAAGQGVLLVEVYPKGLARLWHTAAADWQMLRDCPLPTPHAGVRELFERLYSQSVDDWCRENLPKVVNATRLVWRYPRHRAVELMRRAEVRAFAVEPHATKPFC